MRPLRELEERIGRRYGNAGLLEQALTHKSFANENKLTHHNERLEFLGDAVLNLLVSERLMTICPDSPEGDLSRLRAVIVSEPGLAAVAREIGIGDFIRLGRGEEQTGGRNKDSLLADGLEAIIASVYLDGGAEGAGSFIARFFEDRIRAACASGGTFDYKTALQELCQERLKQLPEYRVVSETGPDHQKQFDVELFVKGEAWGRGTGRSKKEAEQRAAKEALEKLRGHESRVRSQKS
jgi:ribonuclease-3